MRATYAVLIVTSGVFVATTFPFVATASTFISSARFINMPSIPYTAYGTYQTALKAGDTPIFQVSVYSTYIFPPTVSADLSQLGVPSPTTTPAGAGSPNYNSYSFYNFGPLAIGTNINDEPKLISVTAIDAVGNSTTATTTIVVDNVPPTVSLSSITFSTTSPQEGDYMYLSGKIDVTGSTAKVSQIMMRLTDAESHPVVSPIVGGSTFSYNTIGFNAAFATSTDGSFSNIPIQLVEFGDKGWISRATNFTIDITAYDEAGNFSSGGLTVLVPKTAPPNPCATPGACASNVLFLPGIEASRLYRPDYAGGTDKLWEPNVDSDVQDLYMNPDGSSVRNDVYTKDVIDEKNVLPIGQGNIYKSFIAQMNELKASGAVADWKAIPYDWRLTLDDILTYGNDRQGRLYYSGDLRATSTPYIIQELRRLAASSKTGKVTIVAHSNGGLIAKALSDKLGSEASALIDKILFVAVPQTGTPQAVGAVLHGYDQGLPFDSFPLILTPETARALAVNMPSAYNLLPSFQYFTYTQDPVITFDDSAFLAPWRAKYGDEIHSSERLRNFLTDVSRPFLPTAESIKNPIAGNAALLADAETLHDTALDAWAPPPGISLYEVAGWGEDTLATIEYYEGKKTVCAVPSTSTCSYYTTVSTLMYTPKEVVEGDGTVVVPSALWTTGAERYWVDLKKYNKFTPDLFATKHAGILEVPSLRTLIQNILTNATSTSPLAFVTTVQPATDAVADKRLRFLLHSPLNISVTDTLGNVVSYATSTIPGARWKRYGEVQVLSVPQNTLLTLNLDGYASGSFTLDMQEIDGNNVVTASSSFAAIPSATSTKATMSFADGTLQGASPLLLDYDGNGTTDFSLESEIGETTVFDTTPPEARITFSVGTHKLFVEGVDNLSSTTVFTTATSSLITDEAGNTLHIIFKQFTQEEDELKLEIQELRYNGARGAIFPRTVLEYEWSADRSGTLKELEEKATIGMLSAEGAYNAKKNVTKIVQKTKGGKGSKQILPGLVIIGLATDAGKINVNY